MERNVGSLSLMPAELSKRELDDPDIVLILQWVQSGTRPFGPEVCTAIVATRDYWNTWYLQLVENDDLMRCDTTGDHLQLVGLRALCAEVQQHVQNSLIGGHLGQKKESKQYRF